MLCKTVTKVFSRNELYFGVLSLCNSMSLKEGLCVHSPIIKLGLQRDLYLNNHLLYLYAKCFGVGNARYFFDEMPYKDVVSWTGILSACVRNGNHAQALELFGSMINLGHYPNEFTLSSALRSCSALGDFHYGTRIQAYMVKNGYDSNPILASALIGLYSKCDCIEEAYEVFAHMDGGDTVSWSTMICSLVQAQQWSQALQLYIRMIEVGVPPNEFTFVKLLAASSSLGISFGKLVHAHMILLGIEVNVILKTALVDMYSKCRRMEDAVKISNQTPEHDVFLWTAIISGFSRNMKVGEAVGALRQMEMSEIVPNNFTYSTVLNACSSILSLELGEQVHSRVIMAGLEDDVFVGNALVDMYMKCSNLIDNALKVFRGMASPNVITWTSLIAGFAEHGFEPDSFRAFLEMQAVGLQPNSFTLSSILSVCRTIKSHGQTMKLHGYIIKTKAEDIVVGNALVDAYAGLGMVDEAWCVIRKMSHRDAITYTTLATRMNQMGHHGTTLNIITHMNYEDIEMDGFSMASFLSASASLGSMEAGKQLHCWSVKSGLGCWLSVSNSLVDLYGKCGRMHDAHRAFREIDEPDVASWNGLISGLASNGYFSSALSAFEDMRLGGVKPDSVTFVLVLSACSHGDLLDLGLEHFRSMRNTHNMVPQLDHYVCLIDLLGRAGQLGEAVEVIKTLPFRPDALIYKTLLSACRLHRNVPLGEDMARQGLNLHPSDPAFYILLANLYDRSGQSDFGEKTRRLMRERGLRSSPCQSWMETRNQIHVFTAGYRSHPQITKIKAKIESLMIEFKHRGYLYHDNGDRSYHSEKQATAFGLLNTPSMAPILIIKNTRMCMDCHSFIMHVTELVDREIVLREGNRVHSFKKGRCSCSYVRHDHEFLL
ncbi:hypothetical protein I3842_05G254000 [Carya illinoinensis]|uniref:DYW domain-containing protein n=1 Tax=Carya illinoinensis TaxID=32201 RepID=A0A922F3M7_CARIL|nr:hypothetical protein I3842_05G254000 [Carya illinoinensis]